MRILRNSIFRALVCFVAVLLASITITMPVFAAEITISDAKLAWEQSESYTPISPEESLQSTDNGSGTVTYDNAGKFTLTAKNSTYKTSGLLGRNKHYAQNYTAKLTLTNTSDYAIEISYSVTDHSGSVTQYDEVWQKGDSRIFTVSSTETDKSTKKTVPQNLYVTIKSVSLISGVDVSFASSQHGSYTYQIGTGAAATMEAGGDTTAAVSVGVTDLVALTAGSSVTEGYSFYCWMAEGRILGYENGGTYNIAVDSTVYPVYLPDAVIAAGAPFKVGDNSYMFWHLAAMEAANTGKTMVLANNHTLPTTLESNGLISGHGYSDYVTGTDGSINYIVPSSVTFLVPYDAAHTELNNSVYPQYINGVGSSLKAEHKSKLYEKGTLTVPANTAVSSYGKFIVNGQQLSTDMLDTGSACGSYGLVKLTAATSKIYIESGSLFCYGYITGAGSVEVANGASVYELLQLRDWRGFGAALSWLGKDVNTSSLDLSSVLNLLSLLGDTTAMQKTNRSWMFNQYFAQNIEADLHISVGAVANVALSMNTKDENIPQYIIPFMTKKGSGQKGLLNLSGNGKVIREYDSAKDRVIYNFHCDVTTGGINFTFGITVMSRPLSATADTTLNIWPQTNNISFVVKSGNTLTIGSDIRMLPECAIIVEENADLVVAEGNELFIYDVVDWKSGNYAYTQKYYQAYYSASRGGAPASRSLNKSAQLVVNGTLTVENGAGLYTTAGYTKYGAATVADAKSMDKVITGNGTVINRSTATTGAKLDEFEFRENHWIRAHIMETVPFVGKLAGITEGESPYNSFGTATYYSQSNGYWYSYTVTANGGDVNVTTATAATGNTTGEVARVASGGAITFTTDGYDVMVGDTVLKADDNGVYTLSNITENTELTLRKHGSEVTEFEEETATCEEDGHYAYWQCAICGFYYSDAACTVQIPNLEEWLVGDGKISTAGHTYGDWVNTDPEKHWQECSVCQLKSGEAAHSDGDDADANCDTCGRELHTHDYSIRGEVVTPGNCLTETTYQAKCSCGEISGIITGEKDTSRHTGELIWTQTAEKHAQTYSCCDTVTVAEENHEWSDGHCSECAYVCTHKDDNLDHICDYGCGVYQGTHADASNDDDHVCDYGCKAVLEKCSDVTTDNNHDCDICGKQDVTQHSYTSKVTDPTCVDKGYTTYTCNCGDTYTEEIKETGHTEGAVVVENEKAATCKAAGSYDNVIYCTVCNAELSRETIVVEKLAHTAGSAVEENRKESTCTVAGSYDSVVKCSVCGEEMSRNTVALNLAAHTEGTVVVENEKAATCTAEGSYDNVVYCTVCNAELSRQTMTTDEMGHTEVVDAAKTPTCTETGLTEGKHCSVCGEVLVKQETVDALGHDYESVVTAPTFDAQGYTTHTCSKCGDSYVDNYLAALIAVAQVGEQKYESLTEAVAEAAEGATVTLLTDATGAGMMINKNITIDFGGHTYTLNKTVGSAGTETLGFQILKDNNVTLKNGTLTSTAVTSGKEVKVLIQNYANLTLTDMDLEGTNENILYGLSSNSGKITLNGDTDITVHEKAVAFDVYDYSAAGYAVPSMKVNTTGKINGKIEVSETASLAISGGTFTTKIEEKWCAEGFIPTANTDGTYGVKVGAYVAETDGKKYETLAEAVAAAENGSTVNLLTDASGAGVVVNKDITIDFDGHTYTLNRAVGSAGTETLGFQILKENNVTLKNGILTSTNAVSGKEVKVLIQNYSDLTLTDMDLIGTNTNIQYALSNNSGNIVLNGNTDITVHENAVAFDVYDYSVAGYAVPSMKVNTTGKITGNIEVSETATLAISGGTFTTKIEEKWCAEGFIPTVNTDGTYGVKAGVYVAQNGETKYETLADAIAAEGENVIVLQDITIHGPIPATDKIIDFNGHTISGTLLGTLKLSGGTLITAEGKKMAGPDADYYQTTDAMFTMDAALNINVLSGTMTLVPDEWWTLPGQKLEISEGASFVIPAGKTLQVRSEVIVNGEVTIDGTVNLYDANATVTTAIENLNIITTAGDKVWYTEGKYVVHTHTPGAEVTCTEDQICTVCGDVLKEATGHTLTQIEAKAPTCTEIGWEAYEKCSVCDYTTYQEIAAKGHSYESEVTAPTCTAEGYTTYTCSVCNDSYVADKVDALGHTDAEAVKENEKAPTCTVDGSYESVVYCSVCDAELSRNTVTVPASGHTAGEAVTENEKAATCTADGSYDTVVYCTVCDAELSRVTTTVGQLGHSYDDGVETKAPTCTEEGVKTFTCEACGHSYTEAISKASHSYSSSVKEPTCTEEGNETMTCSACGDSYVIKTTPANGHAWVGADCDTPKTCSVCGETEGEALGHSYGEGVVTKEPTVNEVGEKTFTCSVCGDTKTEEIPKLEAPTGTTVNGKVKAYNSNNKPVVKLYANGIEHTAVVDEAVTSSSQFIWNFTFNDVEAGTYDLVVTKAGHLTYTVTGVVVTGQPLDLTAHSNTAVSTMSMLCGDIDGDSKINTADINVIYQAGNYYKAVSEAANPVADLDGDEKINTADINIIYQAANYYKGIADCTVAY